MSSLLNKDRSLVLEEVKNGSCSHFIFHHLPFTTGVTLGNFLRRILSGFIDGIAICGVEISDKEGPKSTYSATLLGFNRVLFILVSDLKQISFREVGENSLPHRKFFCVEMEVKNDSEEEVTVTAADFVCPDYVKINNPNLVLGILSPNSLLKIKLHCQKNRQYQDSDEQKRKYSASFEPEENKNNVIVLNTDYSPVNWQNLTYDSRTKAINLVGDQEDELTIKIGTNGEIEPSSALEKAVELAQDLLENVKKCVEVLKLAKNDRVHDAKAK